MATPAARRVENRVIGADANPYVALAATLACGYLGIKNRIEPAAECKGDAYLSEYQLPRSLSEALGWLSDEKDLHDVLGKEFITVYSEVKEIEHDEFMKEEQPSKDVADLFLTGAGSRAEHYEIAAYTGLVISAKALGETECASLLNENLTQEKQALAKLETVAKRLATAGAPA